MKLKKKTALLASFALGTLLVATTALADIVNKSGYEQLKDAVKVTAENCSEKFNSFTVDISIALKDNGKILTSQNEVEKYDRIKGISEHTSNSESVYSGKQYSYSYSDKNSSIWLGPDNDTYSVTEFTQARNLTKFNNPFKEERAEDVEKIADAVVGNLKDHVVVKENPDGSKELTGSLTEVQIPSLVNAVASFQMKQEFNGRRAGIPYLTQDIFVKEINGKALVNKDGVIESILGTAVLTGKDDKGQIHDLSLEILVKVTDINSTSVSKPDLTGKKVIKEVAAKETKFGPEISNPQKFVGKFKNDILTEKDGKFVKVGERIIEITSIDNRTVAGNYHEEYKQGYEQYANSKREFKFNAKFDKDPRNAQFESTNESGGKLRGSIYIDEHLGKVNFHLNNLSMGNLGFDYSFSPVLE